jgi:uncharacterized membrane protein
MASLLSSLNHSLQQRALSNARSAVRENTQHAAQRREAARALAPEVQQAPRR